MRTRWLPRAVAAAALVAAGCGAPTPPGEAVPGLRAQLSRVDAALVGGEHGNARKALDALVRETVAARDAGRITVEQSNFILAAAARLAADLPGQPAPTPTPRPTARTPTTESGAGEPDKEEKDEGKKDEEKKDEDGDGHNSQNGPDDGEGN